MTSEMHQPPRRDVPSAPSPSAPSAAGVPAARQIEEIASVPRHYGPGTLLVITAAYAMLFAGFKAFGTDQVWWIGTAVFLTGIGIAQVIGGPKRARPASAIAGAIVLPLVVAGAVYALYFTSENPQSLPSNEFLEITGLVCFAILGSPLGYLGGVLVAGIFLLMRYADVAITGLKHPTVEEEPLEPDILEKSGE